MVIWDDDEDSAIAGERWDPSPVDVISPVVEVEAKVEVVEMETPEIEEAQEEVVEVLVVPSDPAEEKEEEVDE